MTKFFYNLLVLVSYVTPQHYLWVAIVLITVLLRLAFVKSSISMAKTQLKQKQLQGEMDEIKKRHKGDAQKQQQALLELYKRENFNPLASCLPMVVQLILFIALYRVFYGMGGSAVKPEMLYSFVPNPGQLNTMFFGIDLAKTVSELIKLGGSMTIAGYALPIITGLTQLYQSLQARAAQPKPAAGDTMQKALNNQMIILFPIMTVYISFALPAALSIYWITQTIFMIIQQGYINKKYFANPMKLEAVPVSDKKTYSKNGVTVEVRKKKSS